MALENGFGLGSLIIGNLCTDQRAAAPDAFRIDLRFLVTMTGILQRPNNAAGHCAANRPNTGTRSGRSQPPRRNNRTQTRYCQQAQAREKTACPSQDRTSRNTARDIAIVIDAFMVML